MRLGLFQDFFRRLSTNLFLQGEVVSLMPNPQPGGPSSRPYGVTTPMTIIGIHYISCKLKKGNIIVRNV
jgi:hypothetical protein